MADMFDTNAIESIKRYMISRQETVAVAESVTSGMIQTAFATAGDASKFYQGGITAFNIGQKYRHLLIEPIHAQSCNCVSERVAREMAINVCKMFQSDWGIGITGYAAPAPESDNKLYAFFAIAYKNEAVVADKIEINDNKEPGKVQQCYVNTLLSRMAEEIKSR